MNETHFSIAEIAARASVSRRTVRYYVQRGLIDPPLGRGRGSAYAASHIEQIQRVLRLQREGVPLRTIEQLPANTEPPAAPGPPPPSVVVRIPLRAGLRLELDAGESIPPPEVLERLSEACCRILDSC